MAVQTWTNALVGTEQVARVYLGATLVWEFDSYTPNTFSPDFREDF